MKLLLVSINPVWIVNIDVYRLEMLNSLLNSDCIHMNCLACSYRNRLYQAVQIKAGKRCLGFKIKSPDRFTVTNHKYLCDVPTTVLLLEMDFCCT